MPRGEGSSSETARCNFEWLTSYTSFSTCNPNCSLTVCVSQEDQQEGTGAAAVTSGRLWTGARTRCRRFGDRSITALRRVQTVQARRSRERAASTSRFGFPVGPSSGGRMPTRTSHHSRSSSRKARIPLPPKNSCSSSSNAAACSLGSQRRREPLRAGARALLAAGGRGGRGNASFKTGNNKCVLRSRNCDAFWFCGSTTSRHSAVPSQVRTPLSKPSETSGFAVHPSWQNRGRLDRSSGWSWS